MGGDIDTRIFLHICFKQVISRRIDLRQLSALILFCFIAFFLNPTLAHHGDSEKVYLCALVSESQINAEFKGGDGSAEGGGFFGKYTGSSAHIFDGNPKEGILYLHGNRRVGGLLEFDAGANETIDMRATIIRREDMERSPFTRLKDGTSEEKIWWLYALESGYYRTVFMTFSRGILRTSIYGNSPTSAVGVVFHHMYDCKFVKP